MILILSGKYQGEKIFAEAEFPGRSILAENVDEYDYSMNDDIDAEALILADTVCSYGSDIICCHITGCGVVPVDERQRYHAELVGRASCILAERAAEVWVVRAGIGERIK